ncbi:MAG TPA: thioredoxin domain-containing protein [Anaerolineales bacterium]|nr:thioredoxin domain-containing protein [Anaerolineales bacterium]
MMENQSQPPESAQPSNRKWIALAVGGGCALVAVLIVLAALAFYFLGPSIGRTFGSLAGIPSAAAPATDTPQSQSSNVVMPPARDHPQAEGNKMGDPNAPVKIIEYADFQCPFCLHYWQETEPQIIQDYVATGKVYYEYRSVGGFIGPESADAANAAYCAGDQNKFWEYHDVLFANWTGENAGDFTPDKLRQYAAAIDLNMDQFNTCLSSGAHTDQVNQDVRDAKVAGVQGTPAFLINGKLIEGAQPYSSFQQAIDAALNGQ